MNHSHHEHHHNHHHHHAAKGGHDEHAGHDPGMFRQKFWISLLLSIPAVVFSRTVQDWFGYEISFAGSEYVPAVFGVIVFFYGGMVFLKSARSEIASKRPGMMTLISMAITVAFVYSLAVTLRLVDGMDFWWELATLVVIMLLGHWIEMASVHNAQGALGELAKLLPDEAEVLHGDHVMKVAVSELGIGDIVLVRPGAKVPIDGQIIKGDTDVDESMLTGESRAVSKNIGDEVIGGTINGSGALNIKVIRAGDDTKLAGIMKLVADAVSSKSKTQVLADKAAFYLTFVAIIAAVLTWIGWWMAGQTPSFILERVVTVLIIACPHALGLAVPLVVAISTSLAAKNGLLVRDRIAFESARVVDVVLFDKTGTLTKGQQGVVDVISADKKRALSIAAALEAESEHAIAKAIVNYAQSKRLEKLKVTNFKALAGRGVQAKLNGDLVYVGGPRLLEKIGIKLDKKQLEVSKKAAKRGQSVIYVIEKTNIIGMLLTADEIRPEAKTAVKHLQDMGKRVAMLTGDSRGTASWVAKKLGIKEYFAEVLPENKSQIMKELQSDGSKVAMVGDGVNDAPALAGADVGLAIGAGTDVAIESADAVLASSDPRGVAKIIHLSDATYQKMVQNLIWATGYNAIALPLAAGVLMPIGIVLSPAVGAVIMSLSTIVVALNAQLLRRLKL